MDRSVAWRVLAKAMRSIEAPLLSTSTLQAAPTRELTRPRARTVASRAVASRAVVSRAVVSPAVVSAAVGTAGTGEIRAGARSGAPATGDDRTATRLMAHFRDTGSDAAFEALYLAARQDVAIWIRSLLRQGPAHIDAVEILQDTFVNVYRYPSGFRDEHPASFRVWVRTIAGNLVRRARSRRGRELCVELPVGPHEPADQNPGPDRLADQDEQLGSLRASWMLFLKGYLEAWNTLAPRDRLALELVELERLPYPEAAARLGVRAANMKMIVFRSRKRLFARMRVALARAA